MRVGIVAAVSVLWAAGAASAAVIINPFPDIQPGRTAAIQPFVTLPPSSASVPKAAAQGLKAPGDGSGRLFINDSRGVIYVTGQAGAPPTPYLDLRAQGVGFSNAASPTQTGLMSFAFHPNFNRDPGRPGYNLVYTIDTTAPSAGTAAWAGTGPVSHHDVVREWTISDPAAPVAAVAAQREVLRVAQPLSDHGPGTIAFAPVADGSPDHGRLYIGLGDGGGVSDPFNNAQNLASPFGKILRIDPADPDGAGPLTYGVPADNPFVGQDGARGEVWAYGLRNPQHFSWGEDGRMLIADIGQAGIEEVNTGTAGANYGWPYREGTFGRGQDKADLAIYDTPNAGAYGDPLLQYDHQEVLRDGVSTGVSIGGVFQYAGSLVPELAGNILMTDLVSGRIFYADPADPAGLLRELLLTLDGAPTSFRALAGYGGGQRVDLRMGVDQAGEIYFLTKRDGAIFRLGGAAVPEPGTWLLLMLGFAAIGTVLRGRRGRVLPA